MSLEIQLAVIHDSHDVITYYPGESSLSREEKETLHRQVAVATSKSAAGKIINITTTSSSHNDNDDEEESSSPNTFAMKDENGNNFCGVIFTGGSDDEIESLLDDLIKITRLSALVGDVKDNSLLPRVTKLFSERCKNTASSEKITTTMESVEIMKRVIEKKKTTSSTSTNAKNTATATPSPKKSASSKNVPQQIVSAEEAATAAEVEKDQEKGEQEHHHQHHHRFHTPEFEAEWKKFESTTQYKASTAIIGLAGVISLVFFFCSPDLSSCQ